MGVQWVVHQLFSDFKKAYDSVWREVLYIILIEFEVPMKLVRPIKMCLNETCSKVSIDKHLSDNSKDHIDDDGMANVWRQMNFRYKILKDRNH
jgi:hypothetical protein